MKIKVPNKIKIAGFEYAVTFDHDLPIKEGLQGEINYRDGTIKLAPRCAGKVLPSTFMHEVLHGINEAYKCHLEEDNVDRLAHGIAEFLSNIGIEFDFGDIR